MSIKILYNDLRPQPPQRERVVIPWHDGLMADTAVYQGLGAARGDHILHDLAINNVELTVAWLHEPTQDTVTLAV